jgi:hypothetical protein
MISLDDFEAVFPVPVESEDLMETHLTTSSDFSELVQEKHDDSQYAALLKPHDEKIREQHDAFWSCNPLRRQHPALQESITSNVNPDATPPEREGLTGFRERDHSGKIKSQFRNTSYSQTNTNEIRFFLPNQGTYSFG